MYCFNKLLNSPLNDPKATCITLSDKTLIKQIAHKITKIDSRIKYKIDIENRQVSKTKCGHIMYDVKTEYKDVYTLIIMAK